MCEQMSDPSHTQRFYVLMSKSIVPQSKGTRSSNAEDRVDYNGENGDADRPRTRRGQTCANALSSLPQSKNFDRTLFTTVSTPCVL